jgi:transposase
VADKGYTSQQVRRYCHQHGIAVTIPTRRNQRPRFSRTLYRERNQVERLFNRYKQFRRVATRYEKRGVNYLGTVALVAPLPPYQAVRPVFLQFTAARP